MMSEQLKIILFTIAAALWVKIVLSYPDKNNRIENKKEELK
jgi:hypothetical protein